MSMTVNQSNVARDVVKEALPEPKLREVPVFDPHTLLPEPFRWWVVDEASRIGCPIEFVALAAIVSAGNLVGPKVAIHPKRHDHQFIIHPNLWGMAVGPPTSKKTPGLKAGLRITTAIGKELRESQKQLEAKYKQEETMRSIRQAQAKKHLETVEKKRLQGGANRPSDKEIENAEQALIRAMAEVKPPELRRLIVNDTTVEKLGEILNHNPGVLQFRDELTGWLNGLAREDRQNDRSFFLEAFNGTGDYTYDRIGRGTVYIDHNIIGVLGGIQPAKLKPMVNAARKNSGDDGLLPRFQVMLYPDPNRVRDEDRPPHQESFDEAYAVYDRLRNLPLGEATHIVFDEETHKTYTQWRHALEDRLYDGEQGEAIVAHIGKYDRLCAALAGLFCTIREAVEITKEDFDMAVLWCNLLEQHAMRVYGMADTADLDGARLIIKRRDQLPEKFKVSHLRDRKWAGMADTESAKAAVQVLLDYGQIVEISLNGKGYEWVK